MTEDTKPTNPKDTVGGTKVSMGLCPDTAIIEMAMAFLEGARKYGRYNWRVSGVSASVYSDAIDRHHSKWWNGQDRDPTTKVRELASVMACCAILIDAEICGVLNDDRPPMAPVGELLDMNVGLVAHLKDLFAIHDPKQYTWKDTPGLATGPLEPESAPEPAPEGFPNGFTTFAYDWENTPANPLGLYLDKPAEFVSKPGPDGFSTHYFHDSVEEAMAEAQAASPLTLPCGCVKRCKGITGFCEGRQPQTETHDAEFPHPPRAVVEFTEESKRHAALALHRIHD